MSTGLSVVSFSSCVSACLLHHSLDKVLWEDEVGRRAGQRAHASDAGRVDDAEADGFTNHQVLFTPAGSCSLSYSNLHQGKDSLLVAALAVSVIMDPTYSSWSWYSVLITPIKSFDGTSQEMWFSWTVLMAALVQCKPRDLWDSHPWSGSCSQLSSHVHTLQ